MTTTVHRHNCFLGMASGAHLNGTALKITIRFEEMMMNFTWEEFVRVYPLPKTCFVVGLGMIMTAEVLTHGELLGIHTTLDHGETTMTFLHPGVVIPALKVHGHRIVLTTGILTTFNGPLKMIVRHTAKTGIERSSIRTIGSGMDGGGRTRGVIILKSGDVTMVGKVDGNQPLKKKPHSRLQLQYPTHLDSQERTEPGNPQHLGSQTNGMVTIKTRTKGKGKTRRDRIAIKGRRRNTINKRRIGVPPMILI